MKALAAITHESPAYPTALYHRIRLLWGTPDKAGKLLQESRKAAAISMFPSTAGSFATLTAPLTASFKEFLEAAEVPVVAYYSWCSPNSETSTPEEEGPELRKLELSRWTITIFNRLLPLTRLLEAARSPELSSELRQELARAVFVRALLLGRKSELLQASREIKADESDAQKLIKDLQNSKNDEEIFRGAMFLVMHAPAFRTNLFQIHHLDIDFKTRVTSNTNWWCVPDSKPDEYNESTAIKAPSFPVAEIKAHFLSPEEQQQARAERETLDSLPSAPDLFLHSAIKWSRDTPEDPRIPEALHLAIKSVRWSTCGKVSSQEAYKILQTRYRSSPWAGKTPHWFAPS